jgi:hypothetical protein
MDLQYQRNTLTRKNSTVRDEGSPAALLSTPSPTSKRQSVHSCKSVECWIWYVLEGSGTRRIERSLVFSVAMREGACAWERAGPFEAPGEPRFEIDARQLDAAALSRPGLASLAITIPPIGVTEAKLLSAEIERARGAHELCGKLGRTNDSFAPASANLNCIRLTTRTRIQRVYSEAIVGSSVPRDDARLQIF